MGQTNGRFGLEPSAKRKQRKDYHETTIGSYLRRDIDRRLRSSTNNILVTDDEHESVDIDIDDVSGYEHDTAHDGNCDRVYTRIVDHDRSWDWEIGALHY